MTIELNLAQKAHLAYSGDIVYDLPSKIWSFRGKGKQWYAHNVRFAVVQGNIDLGLIQHTQDDQHFIFVEDLPKLPKDVKVIWVQPSFEEEIQPSLGVDYLTNL